MRLDYHMHFEYGSYDLAWVQGFFDHARDRGIAEIGISEHNILQLLLSASSIGIPKPS